MGKRNEKTNTGDGDKGKRVRTTSDDEGGKSVSEKSKSGGGKCVGGKCVGENSTGVKSGVTRNSDNRSRRQEDSETSLHTLLMSR